MCVLECGNCNHQIGTAYDSQVALEMKDVMWGRGVDGSNKLIRLEIEDAVTAAYGYWESGPRLAISATNWKDPNYKHFMEGFFTKLKHSENINVKMSFRSNSYAPDERDISLIHTAFLMMFYCFGYEYILSREADIVRDIIKYKMCPWNIGKMIATMSLPTGFILPAAGVIKQPRKIRAFFVMLPLPVDPSSARIIFLPGFDGAGEKSFQRLLSLRTPKKTKINIKIDGVELDAVADGPFLNGFCKMLWQGTAPKTGSRSVSISQKNASHTQDINE